MDIYRQRIEIKHPHLKVLTDGDFKVRDIIKVLCDEHGEFEISAFNVIQSKCGCPLCGARQKNEKLANFGATRRKPKQPKSATVKFDWKQRIEEKFSHIKIITAGELKSTDVVVAECAKHGQFKNTIHNIIYSDHGCKLCSQESKRKPKNPTQPKGVNKRLKFEDFVAKAREVHGDKYQYVSESWVGRKYPCKIVCLEHGAFEQSGHDHLNGNGCQICGRIKQTDNGATSKAEQELFEFVQSLGVQASNRYVNLDKYEADVYIDSLKLAIEYHGLFWHSADIGSPESRRLKNAHRKKLESFNRFGVKMLQIWEDDWMFNQDRVKNYLRSKIIGSTKLYARKCEVVQLTFNEARLFIEQHHLQGMGGCKPSQSIGLKHQGELVSVACFTKRGDSVELVRYCTNKNIVGGLIRLLMNSGYDKVYSFADLEYVDRKDNCYVHSGFEDCGEIEIDYKYVKGYRRIHKFNRRKDDLIAMGADPGQTEFEMAKQLKHRICFDSGKVRFVWKK